MWVRVPRSAPVRRSSQVGRLRSARPLRARSTRACASIHGWLRRVDGDRSRKPRGRDERSAFDSSAIRQWSRSVTAAQLSVEEKARVRFPPGLPMTGSSSGRMAHSQRVDAGFDPRTGYQFRGSRTVAVPRRAKPATWVRFPRSAPTFEPKSRKLTTSTTRR